MSPVQKELAVAGPQNIEIGREAVAEIVVGGVRTGSGKAVLGDDPVSAPVAAAGHASREAAQHVRSVPVQSQNRCSRALVGDVTHAEDVAPAVGAGGVPLADRVSGIDAAERPLLGALEAHVQFRVGRFQLDDARGAIGRASPRFGATNRSASRA